MYIYIWVIYVYAYVYVRVMMRFYAHVELCIFAETIRIAMITSTYILRMEEILHQLDW